MGFDRTLCSAVQVLIRAHWPEQDCRHHESMQSGNDSEFKLAFWHLLFLCAKTRFLRPNMVFNRNRAVY